MTVVLAQARLVIGLTGDADGLACPVLETPREPFVSIGLELERKDRALHPVWHHDRPLSPFSR